MRKSRKRVSRRRVSRKRVSRRRVSRKRVSRKRMSRRGSRTNRRKKQYRLQDENPLPWLDSSRRRTGKIPLWSHDYTQKLTPRLPLDARTEIRNRLRELSPCKCRAWRKAHPEESLSLSEVRRTHPSQLSHYCIQVEPYDLDKIMTGETEWYCWMVDTKDEAEQLPTRPTHITFSADGASTYRTDFDGIRTAPRNKLGELLKMTDSLAALRWEAAGRRVPWRGGATYSLNNNEECCPFVLADEFEQNAGSDEFWGWALADTRCWWC